MTKILNPWKISTLSPEMYKELKTFYALEDVDFELKNNPIFTRRNLLVGHDGLNKWIDKALLNKKVALVSGFMTSGFLHLGSLTVLKQMAYYQKEYNATIIIPIADLEAICVRKTYKSQIESLLPEFLAHFFAAGLSPDKTILYLQSNNVQILRMAAIYTSNINICDLDAIYDRKLNLGEAYSSLVMAADILYPQNNGFDSTLITLGIDEISHFILVKKLIKILGEDIHLPCITYNKILTGLNGSKMGKSIPHNSILLSDSPQIARDKLKNYNSKIFDLKNTPAFNILEWYSPDDQLINSLLEISDKQKANRIAIEEACSLLDIILPDHTEMFKQNITLAKKLTNKLINNNYGN